MSRERQPLGKHRWNVESRRENSRGVEREEGPAEKEGLGAYEGEGA